MDFLISFDDLKAGNKALGKLAQAFRRAGAPVATTDTDPRTRRTSGVNYRQVQIGFTDSQTVTLGVKTSGDIFEVKVNGSVLPIKNQGDQRKAVGEIVKALEAGRAKFQAKMARQKVALPQGISTAAPRMEQKLAAASAELDNRIAAAEARVAELRAELGEPVMDSAEPGSKIGFYVRFKDNSDPVYLGSSLAAAKNKYDTWANRGAGRKLLDKEHETKKNLHWVERSHGTDVDGKIAWGNMDLTDSMLDSVHTVAGEQFDGGEIDDLISMAKHGKVEDGDVVSKAGRDSLVERGFVERGDGMNWLTDKGKEIAAAMRAPVMDSTSDAALDSATDAHRQQIEAAKATGRILKATAHRNATWKEGDEVEGDVVWVWDAMLPKPWAEGQYPRIGNESWAAGRSLFTFTKATPEEIASLQAEGKVPAFTVQLDAVDVPTNTFDQPEVVEAQAIAARILAGDTFDDAQFSHALATLEIALNTVETNHPINLAEGNTEQAELEERAAKDFREAMRLLESKQTAAA